MTPSPAAARRSIRLGGRLAIAVILGGTLVSPSAAAQVPESAASVWTLDNLDRIGGHAVTVVGSPRVVQTPVGPAIEFDGRGDGLFVDVNPIAGLSRFTIEALFSPAANGPEEQRFLHLEEAGSGNRALIELRMLSAATWCLDTYLKSADAARTLIDRNLAHRAGQWHVAALVFDGTTMTAYVDGVEQSRGEVAFTALTAGRTSLGVRQNRVSWFKGMIREVRYTRGALPPDALMEVPESADRALEPDRPREIALWPEGVPGAGADAGSEREVDGRIFNVRHPTLLYYPPHGVPARTAVIVCPGGAYARLAVANEAAGVTEPLRREGVAVFVLKYRLAEFGYPAPLQDVLRAVRMVRQGAADFGVEADRIGVFGASAGGHLAAAAATLYDEPDGRTGQPIDGVSARPDFVALLYPVITLRDTFAHADSRRNLVHADSGGLVDALSLETRVTSRTPPVFLAHTAQDRSVPLENSLAFFQALRKAGVPAELHLYEQGEHGFGTQSGLGTTSGWLQRWLDWMNAHGWLRQDALPRDTWARGIEGRRKADLGNGRYLNPIVPGDHPDPSILKDGADYYMTFSSFDAYPGLVIWHSRDLVNWRPIGATLFKNVGSVWAPDLVKHRGRYYIYFPGVGQVRSNYVIWADDIRGPWSDPIDLKVGRIDPGHAVAADGTRYLFLSGGFMVRLAVDGLSVEGAPRQVYRGWKYPEDWIVESFSQEGPKIVFHGGYYHMVLAEGGTAGPPTGHMIVSARSRSLDGPWENSPHNPIVRTQSRNERWWSKGHGTLVEGPDGRWFIVYHAYENGFYTLGRQTLLEPIEWTADGWFRTVGDGPDEPLAKPSGPASDAGMPYSDDFTSNRMGVQWSFYKGNAADRERYRYDNGRLVLRATGESPSDSSPLWFVTGDHAYEVEVEIERDAGTRAGLLLFYSSRLYAGLGFSDTNFIMHSYGLDRPGNKPDAIGRHLFLRIRNDRHIVTIWYSLDGRNWQRYDRGMEVSGYHHNVAYEFLSLRPAIYAAGEGEVRFTHFKYRALP